jgi:hypothetical protein
VGRSCPRSVCQETLKIPGESYGLVAAGRSCRSQSCDHRYKSRYKSDPGLDPGGRRFTAYTALDRLNLGQKVNAGNFNGQRAEGELMSSIFTGRAVPDNGHQAGVTCVGLACQGVCAPGFAISGCIPVEMGLGPLGVGVGAPSVT